MYNLKIAFRSLLYRKTQYISLFLVCSVGIAISLSSIFISNGMISAMTQRAHIYYGGDLVFMKSTDGNLSFYDCDKVLERLEEIFPDEAVISARYDFDAKQCSFYFEGNQALQKTIKGIDFDKETVLLNKMNFASGGFEDLKNTNGILISKSIADILNIHIDDELTFLIKNINGEQDTIPLVVKGIFIDSSVFGMYTSYMDFDTLKKSYGRPDNFANRICINFPDKTLTQDEILYYQNQLEKIFNMYPLVDDKDDFIQAKKSISEEICALIPLSANLTDVKIMQLAMDAVVSFIIFMLTVIIIAGIGSTYRVLIMKRINEIGIYMAIGMKKKSIMITLLFESFILLIAGCLGALALTGIICGISSIPDFSFIPSFEMFLVKGNLLPRIDVIKSIMVIASVIIVTLMAVFYATWKSIKILPVKALAVNE